MSAATAGSGSDAPEFRGFGPGAHAFLAGLAETNTREWFNARRDAYETEIREPLEALLEFAEPIYGPGKVFRPNRDVRFSRDKSPYKTEMGLWCGGPVTGIYAAVDRDGLFLARGLYDPSREQLAHARDAIVAEDSPAGAQLATVLAELSVAGFSVGPGALKAAPRGYPRDHHFIDLLRLTRYVASRRVDPPVLSDPAQAGPAILAGWAAVDPLAAWLERYGGVPATE